VTDPAAAVRDALAAMPDPAASAWTQAYEQSLARVFGSPHAIAVSSGTAALHTALSAAGIGAGDQVLVPALTVTMTAAAVVMTGAEPVFADSDPETLDLDYDDAARRLTPTTRAVLPVHLWGRMGAPSRLRQFATDHGLLIVEDAAQAAGTCRDGDAAGTVGHAGCFSTKDGKILWSGEGGFILTPDPAVAATCRALRSHWQQPPPGFRPQDRLGANYRLAEPLAAIAAANLARFAGLLRHRQEQTARLTAALDRTPGLTVLTAAAGEHWNGYAPLIRLDLPHPRAFAEHLARRGVPSSTGTHRLIPCDARPMFTGNAPPCRNAARILDTTLALILTSRDDNERIDSYARTIAAEAAAWQT
jgi:perosamine synthetase